MVPAVPRPLAAVLPLALLLAGAAVAGAQTPTFTYQGRLVQNGVLATGTYDFEFKVFDTTFVGTGVQQGPTVDVPAVQVTSGLFSVPLDFGAGVFPGAGRFLEIAVKKTSETTLQTLSPRQPLSSSPYAIRSLNAGQADGLSLACVGCVSSGQVQSVEGSKVTGLIPVASVPGGSPSYIQNGTTPQASADFSISGNGTAAILAANTQFNLGTSRLLGVAGGNSLAAGVGAAANVTTGLLDAFFGQNAGENLTSGSSNSFFGANVGRSTTSGFGNSFFGHAAGFANIDGGSNSFFGDLAGRNTNASSNSFFGDNAGFNNTTGSANSFFGTFAGFGSTTGTANTLIGFQASVSNGLDHATAIGADATVGTSNTIVLGRVSDKTRVMGTLEVFGSQVSFAGSVVLSNAGSGNFFVGGNAGLANFGINNAFLGINAGLSNTSGSQNAFFGRSAGQANTTAGSNSFFGASAGVNTTTGGSNSFFGNGAGFNNTTGGSNSFFGSAAGTANTIGTQNSFFGLLAGLSNTTGSNNVYLGFEAGQSSNGDSNTFVGSVSGTNLGNSNVALGAGAGNGGTGNENVFVGASFGASVGSGSSNTFVGVRAGFAAGGPPSPSGDSNTAVGAGANVAAGLNNAGAIGAGATVTQSNSLILGSALKVGIGNTAPQARLHVTDGSGQVLLGLTGCSPSTLAGVGFGSSITCATYAVQGGDGNTYVNRPAGGSILFRSGGTTNHVIINPTGTLSLGALGPAGATSLCRNVIGEISTCSSSLRYKKDLESFRGGMDLVNRLQPLAFNWKADGAADLGLGAEDVAKVEPRLVTFNDKGEVEGVKYDHLGVVLINALKEQQAELEAQRAQNRAQEERLERQEREIESLKRLLLERRASVDVP